jgi:hypothetical protein
MMVRIYKKKMGKSGNIGGKSRVKGHDGVQKSGMDSWIVGGEYDIDCEML